MSKILDNFLKKCMLIVFNNPYRMEYIQITIMDWDDQYIYGITKDHGYTLAISHSAIRSIGEPIEENQQEEN